MKTTPVEHNDLTASVIAVPPLARDHALNVDEGANRRLIRYLADGGITTFLYGGNANFYDVSLKEYGSLLEMLVQAVPDDAWLIPSVGAAFGMMLDQAEIAASFGFPTVMVLPTHGGSTQDGVATGLRRLAERLGIPLLVYLKREGYLSVGHVAALVRDGVVSAIKYAIVREDPAEDRWLRSLCDAVDTSMVVSGIGERPALDHFQAFGLRAFTSGSVCLAPGLSTRLLGALAGGRLAEAENLRQRFLPIEDLRDAMGPARVLHDAVTLAGIADMGPALPYLDNLSEADRARLEPAALLLRRHDEEASGSWT